jgi:hypothetical protein
VTTAAIRLDQPAPVGDQDVAARAALVCYRSTPTGPITAEWTVWDSTEQARQALAELASCGCGPFCIGVHSVARLDRGPDRKRRGPAKWAKPRTAGTSAPVGTASATDCGGEPR